MIRRPAVRRGALALLAALVLACGGDAPVGADGRDDAPAPAVWRAVEDLRIADETAGGNAFAGASVVEVWRDERIYVASWSEGTVRVYDRDGTLIRRLGGPGTGPGEIQGPAFNLGWLGDTLYVADLAGRVTYFSPDGVLLGLTPVEGRIVPGTLYPTGRSAPIALPSSLTTRDGVVSRTPVLEVSRDGRSVDTLGYVDVQAGSVTGTVGEQAWEVVAPQPYADHPLRLRTADGRTYYEVERRAADSVAGATFSVRRHTREGEELWRRSYAYIPAPTSVDVAQAAVAQAAARAPAAVPRPELTVRLLRLVYRPAFQPPVRQIRVQSDGSFWLQREHDPAGERWDFFSAGGDAVATLSLPSGASPTLFTAEHVYAWGRSEEGAPGLVRYRIERP